MEIECTINLVSCDGDRTNGVMKITPAPHSRTNSRVGLWIGESVYEVLLTDLETACKVMRATGEDDE
jgi:hypothetical protein